MSELPEPLLPADVDLRDFPDMPFAVQRFRDSAIASTRTPEEVLAAIMLWSASWHQVPAASLPASDVELAQFAGYGRGVRDFLRIRRGAVHGLILCADNRYWHPVVAGKAAYAWNRKLDERHRKLCDRQRKFNAERRSRGEPELAMPRTPYRLVQEDGVTRWHYVDHDGNRVDGRRKQPSIPAETTDDSNGNPVSATNGYDGIPASKEKGSEVKGREGSSTSLDDSLREPPAGLNGHAKKASRLPADWRIPDPWRDWAIEAYGLEPQKVVRMSLEFRDYWCAVPGSRGLKLDWFATWRNSVRKKLGDA